MAVVVVVESETAVIRPSFVRERIAAALHRPVIELPSAGRVDRATVVSIVVGPRHGAIAVRAFTGAQATRIVRAPDPVSDGTWIAAETVRTIAEAERAAFTAAGLRTWPGSGPPSLHLPTVPLLPWPDAGALQVALRRRNGLELGARLSAPSPSL